MPSTKMTLDQRVVRQVKNAVMARKVAEVIQKQAAACAGKKDKKKAPKVEAATAPKAPVADCPKGLKCSSDQESMAFASLLKLAIDRPDSYEVLRTWAESGGKLTGEGTSAKLDPTSFSDWSKRASDEKYTLPEAFRILSKVACEQADSVARVRQALNDIRQAIQILTPGTTA